MNEQIRELAEQAGLIKILDEHASEYGNGMFENTPYPELEKFAELIVRECVECADMVGKNNLASGYPNSTAHHVKQKIKQHFGVEE